jgi:hypothetical protein
VALCPHCHHFGRHGRRLTRCQECHTIP